MSPQPSTPQYQLSVLNLFAVYASRAAYQQATGKPAPPFDISRPPQYWEDPSQAGKPGAVTYLIVNTYNAGTGYLDQLVIPCAAAASVNLPGVYTYPAYVSAPTDAQEYGPFGPVGNVSADTVCLLAAAQAVCTAITPLFPGQTVTVVPQPAGVYRNNYGVDPRRAWYIQISDPGGRQGPSLQTILAQALIESQNSHGVGYPGKFELVSGAVEWIAQPPATQPPAGAVNVPPPIRQLLPTEKITWIPGSNPLFSSGGAWVVERTDISQPAVPETNDQQFADIKGLLQQIQADLAAFVAARTPPA